MSSPVQPRFKAATRWAVLAAVCAAALAGASHFLGDYLWFDVAGRSAAFFIYLVWMALILATAAGFTGFLVRLLFPHVASAEGGNRTPLTKEEEFLDIERSSGLFQPVAMYFSFIFVAVAIGAMFAAQALSGGALFSFKIVQLEAMSRSDDAEELDILLTEIEGMQLPDEVQRFVPKLPQYFEYSDESVRASAFRTTSVIGHRMNLSVVLLINEGALLEDRWEPQVVEELHANVSPALRALYQQGVTPKPAIVRAMAWVVNPADLEFLMSLVSDPATPEAEFKEAALGLGNLGMFEGARPLVEAIPHRKSSALIPVFRSLQRIGETVHGDPGDEGIDAAILALLNAVIDSFGRLDEASLCASVLAIGAFQHSGVTEPLIELFESERGGLTCPRVELQEPFGPPVVFVKSVGLRWTLLNLFADIAKENAELKAWVNRAVAYGNYDAETRRGLSQLHGQLLRIE